MRLVFILSIAASFLANADSNPGAVPPLTQAKPLVKVAAVQMNTDPALTEPERCIAQFTPFVKKASGEKADLIVFPEYVLGFFSVSDPKTEALCALAREYQINLIAGGWEYLELATDAAASESRPYANSALIIDRAGNIVARHHKMYAAIGNALRAVDCQHLHRHL